MTKLIGFLIISSLGLLIGRDASAKLWQKHREIQSLKSAMELLMCEIEARNQLIRALEKIGAMQKGRACDFFTSLVFHLMHEPQKGIVSAWNASAKLCYDEVLSPTQLSIFCSLSNVLASGEAPKIGFMSCIENLEKFRQEAEDKAKQDGKMFTGLGLSSGIMLSIILM